MAEGNGDERTTLYRTDDRTTLYRIYDQADELIYVGMTKWINARLSKHRAQSEWWVEVARVETQDFATRVEAARAEEELIRSELPAYNACTVAREERRRRRGGQDYGWLAPFRFYVLDDGRVWIAGCDEPGRTVTQDLLHPSLLAEVRRRLREQRPDPSAT